MDVRTIAATDMPGTPEWKAIADLLSRRDELTGAVERIDEAQRAATRSVQEAAQALADLERRAASGEDVSAAQRKRAEDELSKARARAAEPWAERRKGANAAVADLDARVHGFVIEHFDALAEALHETGQALAREVDRAAGDLVAAHAEREDCARRLSALASMIARVRPGDVSASNADEAAQAASALLVSGEVAPVLRHDPRQPRHGELLAEAADMA
jgi:hypothetical protein